MGLLADADKNIEELQTMSKAASQRLFDLATQWEEHRVPLVEQYRKLKDAQMNKEDETKVNNIHEEQPIPILTLIPFRAH